MVRGRILQPYKLDRDGKFMGGMGGILPYDGDVLVSDHSAMEAHADEDMRKNGIVMLRPYIPREIKQGKMVSRRGHVGKHYMFLNRDGIYAHLYDTRTTETVVRVFHWDVEED